MAENKTQNQSFKNHLFAEDHELHIDLSGGISPLLSLDEDEEYLERSSIADHRREMEQISRRKFKQQEREQYERSTFRKGSAQEHQQGNRQR